MPASKMKLSSGDDLKIEYLPVVSLRENARNTREHNKRHVRQIADSIRAFGFISPILRDAQGTVIAGHGRLAAAKLLGMDAVPAVKLEHLSEMQLKAYMIADNRLSDLSRWDTEQLGSVLLELSEADLDFDLSATGFSVAEIDLMVLTPDAEGAAEEEIPAQGPMVASPGELWRMGRHLVLCGDALDAASYALLMQEERADVVATDPPYNVPIPGHVSGLGKVKHQQFLQGCGELSETEFIDFLRRAMRHAADVSREGALHYYAMDWRHLFELTVAARAVFDEQVNLCVWAKTAAGMGSFYRSQHELFGVWRKGAARHRNNVQLGRFGRSRANLWSYPGANGFGRAGDEGNLLALHPTVKPVALVADILLDSTKRGDIVLDPFLGSGSTIIAAEKVGRQARGIELDPRYVDVIIRRWQRWTGERARRADGAFFDELEAVAASK